MNEKKTIEQIDQEITEYYDLNNYIKIWVDDYKKNIRKTDDDFTFEITKENPEWVKEKRLEYLKNKLEELNQEYIKFWSKIREWRNKTDKNKNFSLWYVENAFADLLETGNCYGGIPPKNMRYLKDVAKDIKKMKFEIDCWTNPELLNGSGGVTPEEVNMAREVSCEYFIEVKRTAGDKKLAVCPFHNDTNPSLTIYPAGKGYHCFSCGAHGDVIDLVMKTKNLNFISAVKLILQYG